MNHPDPEMNQHADDRNPSDSTPTNRVITIPNGLCAIRLFGSPLLLLLAWGGYELSFVVLFVFLAMTDWVDGKLAILLNQRSTLGARLDSWADAALYSSLLLGGLWLQWQTLLDEFWWIAAAVVSYAVTTLAGFWKFGRWPSYHTRAAKISWLLTLIGALVVLGGERHLGDWAIWLFRLAMVAVTVTNVESVLITTVLDRWRTDVSSLAKARQLSKQS